jgi:uncharacterized protein with FMN-binding domain
MVNRFEKRMDATVVENVDFTDVKDGEYKGVYDLRIVSAHVIVGVKDGRVTQIDVKKHDHGPGYGAEAVAERVIEKQSLDVDAVSKATASSTVVLKAIELALRKGLVRKAEIMQTDSSDTISADTAGQRIKPLRKRNQH